MVPLDFTTIPLHNIAVNALSAHLVDAVIPSCVGIWITLMAYGVIKASPKFDQLRARNATLYRIGGPALILFGVFQAVSGMSEPTATPTPTPKFWQRFATNDGACSIEFPAQPKSDNAMIGGLLTERHDVYFADLDEDFRLSYVELPVVEGDTTTDDQRADRIRDGVATIPDTDGKPMTHVDDHALSQPGFAARELTLTNHRYYTLRMRVYVAGRRAYRATATTPPTAEGRADADVFLSSIRFTR